MSFEAEVEGSGREIQAALEALRRREQLGPLPILAAPHRLPRGRRPEIALACERLRSALLRTAGPERWNPAVPIPAGLEPLLDSEPMDLERLGMCRLDALCNADGSGLKFLEVQAGDPSGVGWVEAIAAALAEVPALAQWMKHWEPLVPPRRQRLLRAFGGRNPKVAVVNEDHSFVVSDAELLAKLLRSSGLQASRVDPRGFQWERGRLLSGGTAWDVVLRDSHEELTLSPGPAACAALCRALEAGLPRLNPFRDVWFDDKACFALLWEGRSSLPPEERAAVEAYLPPTVLVGRGHLEQLRAEQQQWVLKPAVGYGGFQVVVGPSVDAGAWEAALERASSVRTIAQHFVPAGRQPVARLEGSEVAWRSQHVTVSFWCHGGSFSGGYARAGDQPVVNVHQGGGIGPLVFA